MGVALALVFVAWVAMRGQPQDLPWTPLDLGAPIGLATGGKLAALGDDFPACRVLLDRAGVRYDALAPRRDGPACGFDDGVRLVPGGARGIAFAPAGVGVACPVAAALAMWEWRVVQPAARRRFAQGVASIEHLGSYNCRRMYGSASGAWSEHATANALDVAGFRLANGRRVTILGDWNSLDAATRAFLRDVRDGACEVFATTLSPDYNAAHRDHLHLDQASRGSLGRRACR
ncbi:MAG TPA: extensin family protein [Sphingomonas sp.]